MPHNPLSLPLSALTTCYVLSHVCTVLSLLLDGGLLMLAWQRARPSCHHNDVVFAVWALWHPFSSARGLRCKMTLPFTLEVVLPWWGVFTSCSLPTRKGTGLYSSFYQWGEFLCSDFLSSLLAPGCRAQHHIAGGSSIFIELNIFFATGRKHFWGLYRA